MVQFFTKGGVDIKDTSARDPNLRNRLIAVNDYINSQFKSQALANAEQIDSLAAQLFVSLDLFAHLDSFI